MKALGGGLCVFESGCIPLLVITELIGHEACEVFLNRLRKFQRAPIRVFVEDDSFY